MRPRFKESKYYQDWFNKAKRDLDTAILNHQHGGYTDTTCYFCQQVVEKALKAFLLYKQKGFVLKTHILSTLLYLCCDIDKDFNIFTHHCEILDRYYIETKYPANPSIDYSRKETAEALLF